jgi:hypothetical protein
VSCPGCLWTGCPALNIPSWLSCHGCPVLTILFWLYYPSCPVMAVLFLCPIHVIIFAYYLVWCPRVYQSMSCFFLWKMWWKLIQSTNFCNTFSLNIKHTSYKFEWKVREKKIFFLSFILLFRFYIYTTIPPAFRFDYYYKVEKPIF